MELVILKENFSHMIKKPDAWIVYTKDRKCYVCNINSVKIDKNIVRLTLHDRRVK